MQTVASTSALPASHD